MVYKEICEYEMAEDLFKFGYGEWDTDNLAEFIELTTETVDYEWDPVGFACEFCEQTRDDIISDYKDLYISFCQFRNYETDDEDVIEDFLCYYTLFVSKHNGLYLYQRF